ncbi:hypothetical protein AB6735_18565 [Mucilaginibacter sp. RCC_168]|uniref:hypothetical protein n=1 Tax=Mucilaginibacter sp. RCC_168 TaxID=3239221 RepID=UPI0035260757
MKNLPSIPLDIERIIAAVCTHRNLHYKGVIGRAASRPYVIGRNMAVCLVKHFKPHIPVKELGEMFGRGEKFTYQAKEAMKQWCKADRMLKRDFNLILLKIQFIHNNDPKTIIRTSTQAHASV